jgi:hypothetical protein
MAFKPTKSLTGDELCNLCDRFGPDRLSRLLLWESARLRRVVLVLYRQIFRLSYHSPDEVGPGMDEETEAALDAEPVILENSGHTSENYKYGRCAMSDNNRLSRKLAALIIAPWTTKTFPRN